MERRTFLKWATNGLGALFGAILGIPAIAYLLDPRNRPAPPGDFKTVAKINDLEVGVPKQVVIRDMRRDAWTLHPNDVIGRVWLVKKDEKEIDAFTTICPHLGCSVNFEEKDKLFICPCHNGTFNLQGERVERTGYSNPVPRGMDHLEWRPDPNDAESIQVKYENFEQGRETPIRKT